MPWIAAAIAAVGGIAQTAMKADAAKATLGGMALPSNGFDDHSMNNSGMVVTTSGASAQVTANTESTRSPQLGQTQPIITGMGGGLGGLDLQTILMIAGFILLAKRKG